MRVVNSGRARRWLWALTAVAILAAGVLSHALAADPGPITGLEVTGSGFVLALSIAMAARILVAFGPPRRHARSNESDTEGGRHT